MLINSNIDSQSYTSTISANTKDVNSANTNDSNLFDINEIFPKSKIVQIQTDRVTLDGFPSLTDDRNYQSIKVSSDGSRIALTVPGSLGILSTTDGSITNIRDRNKQIALVICDEVYWDYRQGGLFYVIGELRQASNSVIPSSRPA